MNNFSNERTFSNLLTVIVCRLFMKFTNIWTREYFFINCTNYFKRKPTTSRRNRKHRDDDGDDEFCNDFRAQRQARGGGSKNKHGKARKVVAVFQVSMRSICLDSNGSIYLTVESMVQSLTRWGTWPPFNHCILVWTTSLARCHWHLRNWRSYKSSNYTPTSSIWT